MILCPKCGSQQSLRKGDGERECCYCGHVYKLPTRKRSKASEKIEPGTVEAEPVETQEEE